MYCKKCGENLPEGTKFCSKCGQEQDLVSEDFAEDNNNFDDTTEMEPVGEEVFEVDPFEKKDTSEVFRIKREEIKEEPVVVPPSGGGKKEKKTFFKAKPGPEAKKGYVFPWNRKKEEAQSDYMKKPEVRYYPEHDVAKPEKSGGLRLGAIAALVLFLGQLGIIFYLLPFMSYSQGRTDYALLITGAILLLILILNNLAYSKAAKKTGIFLGRRNRNAVKAWMYFWTTLPFTITLLLIYILAIYNRQTALLIFGGLVLGVIILMKSFVSSAMEDYLVDPGLRSKFAKRYRNRFVFLILLVGILIVAMGLVLGYFNFYF